jgi:hypothetical protein
MKNSKISISPFTEGYMQCDTVIACFNHQYIRATLASIIQQACPIHKINGVDYYNIKDLQKVMMPDIWKELASRVITNHI